MDVLFSAFEREANRRRPRKTVGKVDQADAPLDNLQSMNAKPYSDLEIRASDDKQKYMRV